VDAMKNDREKKPNWSLLKRTYETEAQSGYVIWLEEVELETIHQRRLAYPQVSDQQQLNQQCSTHLFVVAIDCVLCVNCP